MPPGDLLIEGIPEDMRDRTIISYKLFREGIFGFTYSNHWDEHYSLCSKVSIEKLVEFSQGNNYRGSVIYELESRIKRLEKKYEKEMKSVKDIPFSKGLQGSFPRE